MRNGWVRVPFGSVVTIASGQVDPKKEPFADMISVGPDNLLSGGGIDKEGLRTARELGQISGKYAFDAASILYSKIRPNLNKVALPDFSGICSADMYPLWPVDENHTDRGFLFFTLISERFVSEATSRSFRTGLAKINRPDLEGIEILLPPIAEQRRIAFVLETWGQAIEKLAVLRALKEQRLVGLRAALLFGELRLNGQRRNWAPTRLGAVTHELTRRNGAKGLGRDLVIGVTKAEGVVPMREQTIAGDISRYKRLPPRAFAYNPMRINVGSIAMNEREEEVLVSPDYVVFACNADGLDPDYLDHLRKTSWWAHYINSGGSGSVRQRTYYDDLAALKLPLPELDEQKAIAAVLNTARADLAATEREIEAVTLQKRGLMQKLLTGEWRVPLAPAETSAITEETEHAG